MVFKAMVFKRLLENLETFRVTIRLEITRILVTAKNDRESDEKLPRPCL